MLRKYRYTLIKGLEEDEVKDLYFACENHTSMLRSGNKTIDTCFDADRLDLTRIGIIPIPERMATQAGADFAKHMDIFDTEIREYEKEKESVPGAAIG